MKWLVLIVVAVVCLGAVWIFVLPKESSVVASPPSDAAPMKFDTQGGQEMRPLWNR